MNNDTKISKPLKVRRTFYLPKEINDWLEMASLRDRRSVSNFLTDLLVKASSNAR
jgi:hypothetical protein